MFLSIQEMELKKVCFDETFEPGQIDFSDEFIRQASPLHATGEAELLESTGGEVRVKGEITVEMASACDRCLGAARFPLSASVDLFYEPAPLDKGPDEVAINEGEAEIAFYEGDGLELEDILREQVLLLLPMQRVCSESCKGICPVCGKNRNETDCNCQVKPGDDRWNALRDLVR